MRSATIWLAVLVLGLTGCATTDVEDLRELSRDYDQVIAEGKELAKSLPDGEQRDRVIEGVEEAEGYKAKVDTAIDDYLARVAAGEVETGLDSAASGAKSISTVLPPPAGEIAALIGIGLAGIANSRRRRAKRATESVVGAIESAKSEDGKVDFNDPLTKAALRSSMSTDARDLVEKVRSK